MRRFIRFLPIVAIALSPACDEADFADESLASEAPASERPGGDEVSWRTGIGGTGGGSTRLNTAMLFQQGVPIHHFNRNGSTAAYEDPDHTQVKFQSVKLRTGKLGAFVTYGSTTNDIAVENGQLRINTTLFPINKMIGSEWLFKISSDVLGVSRSVTVKITGAALATVPGNVQIPLYNFSLAVEDGHYEGGPYSACAPVDTITSSQVSYNVEIGSPPIGTTNNFNVTYSSALYGGITVDPTGGVDLDPAAIYLACVSGSIGKSALWGYQPWGGEPEVKRRELEATSRVIRADYCGDGVSHTQDGTEIQVRDRFYNGNFDNPAGATEAVWGDVGSQCLVKDNRLFTAVDYDCGGTLTADCNAQGAAWLLNQPSFMWTKASPSTLQMPPPMHACTVIGGAGCNDPGIEAVVCAADSYCCNYAWDSICVNEVTSFNAAAQACCAGHGGPGCGDAAVSACVGGYDAFCAVNTWDSLCASEVEMLGCGSCR